jgi:predicted phosphodiesterase
MCLSDTHGVKLEENTQYAFSLPLPRVDVVLHSSDLTQCGSIRPFKSALNMLGELDAELKLVIAGNHDLELDAKYGVEEGEEAECAEAIALMTGPRLRQQA